MRARKRQLRADLPVGSVNQGSRQQRDAFMDGGALVDKAGADHADEPSVRDASSERGTFDTKSKVPQFYHEVARSLLAVEVSAAFTAILLRPP